MPRPAMRTIVYVDGFNLYYRAVRNTPWKWLDLNALFRTVLGPSHQITRIKYFTARVSAEPNNPSKPQRQDAYLRALKACSPPVSLHFGRFVTRRTRAQLANPRSGRRTVQILRTEEKGTDVNLAAHLLDDAWRDRYDVAVVVSNDGDLAEAVRLAKLAGKRVGVANPSRGHASNALRAQADFVRQIRQGALRSSQLPDPIPGTSIAKPPNW
ncbi:MAG: NYN domain-containing protein [Gammaproteobacteria bacterium]|nr:NYN domain-containing protein [Gammaproteobacteria bacterium]MDE0192749.1 NYN domain-containing protein [Gammaproteobacteria bacterium]